MIVKQKIAHLGTSPLICSYPFSSEIGPLIFSELVATQDKEYISNPHLTRSMCPISDEWECICNSQEVPLSISRLLFSLFFLPAGWTRNVKAGAGAVILN